jgi:hypothetical protein
LIAYNPQEVKHDRFQREKIVQTVEKKLADLKQLPNKAHRKQVCYFRSHCTYGKYIRQLKNGTLKLNKQAVRDAEKLYLRPIYHRLENQIRSHVLISCLTLLLVRIIEVKTGSTWEQLRKEMNRLHLGHFSTKDGDLYQCTDLSTRQRQIFADVGVEPPPKIVDIHLKS